MARKSLRPGDIIKVERHIGVVCSIPEPHLGSLFVRYRDIEGGRGGGGASIPANTRRLGRVDAPVLKKLCKGVGR